MKIMELHFPSIWHAWILVFHCTYTEYTVNISYPKLNFYEFLILMLDIYSYFHCFSKSLFFLKCFSFHFLINFHLFFFLETSQAEWHSNYFCNIRGGGLPLPHFCNPATSSNFASQNQPLAGDALSCIQLMPFQNFF